MKKRKKLLFKILFIIIVFQFIICNNTVEASERPIWGEIISQGDKFMQIGESAATEENTTTDLDTMKAMNDIYSLVFPLGVAVTLIVGGFLGIKFMLSSAEDKAKLKESMIPYVVGCIAIYGSITIWKICIQILSTIS